MLCCASDEPARINVRNSSMAPWILTLFYCPAAAGRGVQRDHVQKHMATSTRIDNHTRRMLSNFSATP